MLIKIAERLRPFSHEPGTRVVLPSSALRLTVYPETVVVETIAGSVPVTLATMQLSLQGPLEQFTIQQDLEKGCVRIWGRGQEGFLRYSLYSLKNEEGILCRLEKGFAHVPVVTGEWKVKRVDDQHLLIAPSFNEAIHHEVYKGLVGERLSLGNHKAQDWTLIHRRNRMEEILPLWYGLGQQVCTKSYSIEPDSNSNSLIEKCRQTIHSSQTEQILSWFRALFLAGFEGMLSPRREDEGRQGIWSGPLHSSDSPLCLLTEGVSLIRSLFVQQRDNVVALLPALPPEFHCGRLINVSCGSAGVLSLEWSKKDLRCVTFSAEEDRTLAFVFMREKIRCRLRTSNKDRGTEYVSNTPLKLTAGQSYWFDNFKKGIL